MRRGGCEDPRRRGEIPMMIIIIIVIIGMVVRRASMRCVNISSSQATTRCQNCVTPSSEALGASCMRIKRASSHFLAILSSGS